MLNATLGGGRTRTPHQDFIIDLSVPLEIAADTLEEAQDISAAWFLGLRKGLSPGLLYAHAVNFNPPAFQAVCSLALRIRADCAAGAISRIPDVGARFKVPGVVRVGDWRSGFAVRSGFCERR